MTDIALSGKFDGAHSWWKVRRRPLLAQCGTALAPSVELDEVCSQVVFTVYGWLEKAVMVFPACPIFCKISYNILTNYFMLNISLAS
jgi:hypothetical protein